MQILLLQRCGSFHLCFRTTLFKAMIYFILGGDSIMMMIILLQQLFDGRVRVMYESIRFLYFFGSQLRQLKLEMNILGSHIGVVIHADLFYYYIIIAQLMSKAKSQPPQLGKSQKTKSDFVYKAEDDMYLFQTRDLFMQVQFRSPIKQIQQYLEQYEKYCFHSEMTSIGIKSSQQKTYYDQIFKLIHSDFHEYLQKTMGFIQQMLMNVHFMKVERWHYFTQLIRGYKTLILHKDIDCYDFNPEQFNQNYQQVMEYLSRAKDITRTNNRKQIQQIKLKIRKHQKQIKYKLDQIYENMFVKNPIRTQNQGKKQIDSDLLFYRYINRVLYKTEGYQSCLPMRFHNAYDPVTKFFGVLKELSLKGQQMASIIIKQYNDNCLQTMNQISRNKFRLDKKIQIQLNDCKISSKRNDKLAPILRNKIQKVDLSNRVICKDEQTLDSYGMLLVEDSKIVTLIKTEEDELFSNRVPANNPYFDFWAHVYDRDRLRKLQLFYEMPKKPRKQNQNALMARQYANRYARRFGREKVAIEQSQYFQVITERAKQQSKIWEIKDKKQSNHRRLYQYVDETQKKRDPYYRPTPEEQTKIDKLTMKVRAYKQYHEKHEKQLKNQMQSKLARLPRSTKEKNYVQYASKFAIKDKRQQWTSSTIFRYGIQLHKALTDNVDLPKFEEFLFNFLRQKLFRENDKYKDKDSTPIIFNGKTAQQFNNLKTIKKLGELTKQFKRYYIWASDIIKYEEFEELTGIKKQTKGRFTFYSYTNVKNSQSLLFELKRRLNIKIMGQIVDIYKQYGPCCIESSLSKLQLFHRLLFNQHMETPTADLSFEKGRQIFNSIVKGLSTMSTNFQDTSSYKNQ